MSRSRNQDRKGIDPEWSQAEKQDAAFHGSYFTRDRGAALEIAILLKRARATMDVALTRKCGAFLVLAKPETLKILSETISYVESFSSIDPKTGAVIFDTKVKPMADEKHWNVQAAYYECKNAGDVITVRNVLKIAARTLDGVDEKTVTRILKMAALPYEKGEKGRPRKADNKSSPTG